jgi:hypothetical protein
MLEEFKHIGRAISLYSQRKIYCQHRHGHIFTAWKLVKLYVTHDCDSQFVALVRPTDYNNDKKLDILLFN